jgi:O-antigen/teichoic acid export membrane protein
MNAPRSRLRSSLASASGKLRTHRALAEDTGYVLAVQLLSRGVLNLVTIAAANILTVAQFSSYNYYLITTNLIGAFAGMGLSVAATTILAGAASSPGEDHQRRAAALVWILIATAAFSAAVAPFLLPLVQPDEVSLSAILLIAGSIVLAIYGICNAAMQGAGAFRATLLPVTVGAAMLVGGTFWSWTASSELPLLIGMILFYLVPTVLFVAFLRSRGRIRGRWLRTAPGGTALREVAATALPSLGAGLIFTGVNWWIARMLLAHQGAPEAFPQFVIGMQWFSLALFVPLAVSQAIFPRYVQMARTGQLSRAAIVQPALLGFGLVLLLVLVAVPATPLLSLIYGSNYDFGMMFVAAILLAAALSAPAGILGQCIIAAAGAGAWLRIYVVFFAVGVGLPLLFPPQTALAAAAILGAANLAVLLAAVATLASGRGLGAAKTLDGNENTP